MKLFYVLADGAVYYIAANDLAEAEELIVKHVNDAIGEIPKIESSCECTKDVQIYCEDESADRSGLELANECRVPTIIACSEW